MNGLKNVRQRHNDALTRTDWARLEELLAAWYLGQGWQVEHCGTGLGGKRFDGGIDLRLRREDQSVLVQCKHWNAKQVPHNEVHQLIGLMVNEGATGAILVTSGEFTTAAREAASKLGHVQLVDGLELRSMLGPVPEAVSRPLPMPPGGPRTRPRPQAWPWIVVAVICLLGFVLVFRALLARTAWSAGANDASNDPAAEVGHFAAAGSAAVSGNQAALRQHPEDMQKGLLRDMKIPDPNRRIDPEGARAALRSLPGVRSSAWADRENLIVVVDGAVYRNDAMIDAICRQLDPLGDTLAVVVHVENVAAGNADELQTISRNCQLAPGDRAFMQSHRSLDVVPESTRQQRKAFDRQVKQGGTAKQDKAAVDALMKNTPEM